MLLHCGRGIFLVLCTRKNALYRTAAEQNLLLRDPPQAKNPAEQDSIFVLYTRKNVLYRTAAVRKVSLRDPPQAENPAEQDSILGFTPYYKKRILGKRMQYYRQKME